VIIGGAVTKPGPYKLLENMKVRDLILQAGGLSEDASPKRGEIYRREMNGTKILTQKIEFCVECAMNDQQEDNILIQRSDRVFVRQRQGWETERSVTLQGQFVYPGTYGIFEGETLGDLIKRAGGFKEDAYLEAAVFTRQTVLALEKKQRMEFLQESETNTQKLSATLAANDKSAEAEALISRQEALRQNVISDESLGRVIVDLTSPGAYSNFALEDKDLVFIPRNMNTVAVIGEVFNPATFTFNKNNQSPFYYVEAAGGYKASADRKSVYVIKANGSVITNKMQKLSKVKLMPGDAVMVPQQTRIVEGRKIFMDSLETIVKILTTAVMTITLVVAVNNMK
jgi:protein involved in polysaccharide export with SLBB domain